MRCRVIQDNFDTEEIAKKQMKYDDIFSENIVKQKEITSLFLILFKIRNKIQENQNSQPAPSNTDVMLRTSNNLHDCIVYLSSGN